MYNIYNLYEDISHINNKSYKTSNKKQAIKKHKGIIQKKHKFLLIKYDNLLKNENKKIVRKIIVKRAI